jgi:hypothetical protein
MSKCVYCKENESFEEGADTCEQCIINATERSLANFGTPEFVYCGGCGEKVPYHYFAEHCTNCKFNPFKEDK